MVIFFKSRRSLWDPTVSTVLLLLFSLSLALLLVRVYTISLLLSFLVVLWLWSKLSFIYVIDSEGVKVLRRGVVVSKVPLDELRESKIIVKGGKPRKWAGAVEWGVLIVTGRGPGIGYLLDIGDVEFKRNNKLLLKVKGVKVGEFLEKLGEALKYKQ